MYGGKLERMDDIQIDFDVLKQNDNTAVNIKENKNILRKKILNIRDTMEQSEVIRKSKTIIDKLMSMEAWKNSNVMMSYVSFRNEVITTDLIKKSLSEGKRVAVPLVAKTNKGNHTQLKDEKAEKMIIACEIYNLDTDLERSSFGILEPNKDMRREIDVRDIELIIVPGIAFDINKNRLGFGAGYYDKFLKSIRQKHQENTGANNLITIGIAFEEQLVDAIPVEAHDVPLDIIITEKRVIE